MEKPIEIIKSYYPRKNDVVLTKEKREALMNAYGFTVKDIMCLYNLSYAKALAFFKSIKDKYGSCPMDDKQVRRVDVLDAINSNRSTQQKKVDNERA